MTQQQQDTPLTAQRDLEAAVLRMSRQLAVSMRPIIRSMKRAVHTMHAAVWRSYRLAGMPHGETEDGLLRWVSERQEAQAAREREASIRATCAQLRAERVEREKAHAVREAINGEVDLHFPGAPVVQPRLADHIVKRLRLEGFEIIATEKEGEAPDG